MQQSKMQRGSRPDWTGRSHPGRWPANGLIVFVLAACGSSSRNELFQPTNGAGNTSAAGSNATGGGLSSSGAGGSSGASGGAVTGGAAITSGGGSEAGGTATAGTAGSTSSAGAALGGNLGTGGVPALGGNASGGTSSSGGTTAAGGSSGGGSLAGGATNGGACALFLTQVAAQMAALQTAQACDANSMNALQCGALEQGNCACPVQAEKRELLEPLRLLLMDRPVNCRCPDVCPARQSAGPPRTTSCVAGADGARCAFSN